MTTVLMVSGSWPPQVCGVGDYTERLCRELEQSGVSVVRFADSRLSNLLSPGVVREIEAADADVVHVQYPTAGYRRSYVPSSLALGVVKKPVVVTFHEYSVFKWYRRVWFTPFARRGAARIFTTDDERRLFESRFPKRSGTDDTIEIASNIPLSAPVHRELSRVSYFGLIAPHKGLEEFIDLCELAASRADGFEFELIGAVSDRHRRYAEEILSRALECGVHASLSLPNDAVAARLAGSGFAYLPFPDGASAKRGSLAAAIVNGAVVLTRHSAITPDWMRAATVEANSPAEALRALIRLRANDRQRAEIAMRGTRAAARFRWDAIANRHIELYRRLTETPKFGEGHPAAQAATTTAYESRLAS